MPFLGRRMSLTYEVIRCAPGHGVLLAATSGVLRSTDRIVVTGAEDRSMVWASARSCGLSCFHPSRAPTRSSGWPPRRR